MEWWQILLIVWATVATVVLIAAFIVWRKASARTKRLAGRLQALTWPARAQLMGNVLTDDALPPHVRLILPLLLLYLSLPIDLIPDVIPVIGQIDDALAVGVGIGLLRGSSAWRALETHLAPIEGNARNTVIEGEYIARPPQQ